ncbi:MAG: DUF2512 family protein [Symbiobacterium sp.]|uniref:DUF2512 family protein n=1 Tax=Symbiobacterium sp. TaxID=1971213 RepID=UPI0034647505
MRHVNALCLKLAAYILIFAIALPAQGRMALAQSLIMAAVHTLVLWLADLMALPRLGRGALLGGDAAALLVGSLLMLRAMHAAPRIGGLLVAVALAVLFEAWFHYHLAENRLLEG